MATCWNLSWRRFRHFDLSNPWTNPLPGGRWFKPLASTSLLTVSDLDVNQEICLPLYRGQLGTEEIGHRLTERVPGEQEACATPDRQFRSSLRNHKAL